MSAATTKSKAKANRPRRAPAQIVASLDDGAG